MDKIKAQNNLPFIKRFYIYQKERFPFIGHGIMIASFTFSVIAYSRMCRGLTNQISWDSYLIAAFTTVSLFFLVRIFDEFKDKEEDAKFRSHLPVPRGLISFKELTYIGIVTAILQITINIIFNPIIFILYFVVIGFLLLMGKEFFVPKWLKKHLMIYALSHMFIIPLIDVYASGMDWLREGVPAPKGLIFFFVVSYLNGFVLEFGRKIRNPEREEFNTYSTMFGPKKATIAWIFILLANLAMSITAAVYVNLGNVGYGILVGLFCLAVIPAFLFLKNMNEKNSKLIELSSGLWAIAMYLTLGGIPMLIQLLFK